MRATCSPEPGRAATRWLVRASKPSAPTSGTRSVIESRTVRFASQEWAAASTASLAITRYVVSLPPAIITRPGTGVTTVCSREIREVGARTRR